MADLRVPTTSADEVRRIADEVLTRPEFAEAQPTWWQRFLQLVSDFFDRTFDTMAGTPGGSATGTLVFVLLAVAVIAAVLYYTRSLRRDPRLDRALSTDVGRSSADWIADAQRHEHAEQWREAVRCRYRALLAALAEAGLIDEIAGRTSGEYVTAVGQDVPAAAEAFATATQRFEVAWYGHHDVTRWDLDAFNDTARQARSDAGIRRSAVGAAS